MWSRLAQKLWGKFDSKQECAKFVRLAAIFAFTIGVYWIINPTKDPVFLYTVGLDYLPYAKMFSLIIMIPTILLYGRLVDAFPRHRVFYALCILYACGSCVFGYFMMHPTIGLANTVLSKWRLLGWSWYAFVESFGSIIVALFWSFAADTSTPESAKRGFSVIALGAQIGGVLAPLAFYGLAKEWGPVPFAFIGAGGMLCIAALVFYFMWVTPQSELVGFSEEVKTAGYRKPKTGFFEGIGLIASSSYLIGIVGVVTLYEVVGTVIEFHLKTLAKMTYGSINELNSFFFRYAICANGMALLCLILGVGAIGRNLGLLRTLLLLPALVSLGIVMLTFNFNLSVALFVFVVIRGLNYALNQPAKEQLYIPTSRQSKYKAKAWIDMFGSRMAKGVGSSVHILRPVLQLAFVGVSSLICSGLVAVWVFAALFVGKRHAQAIKEDRTIC
jgi:AAA family ATP:ADP antiporter